MKAHEVGIAMIKRKSKVIKENKVQSSFITKECNLDKELFVFGTKCNKCGKVYIGEWDAAALYPNTIHDYYTVKGVKRSLLINRNTFKCKCGNTGFLNFSTILLLHAILKDSLKKHINHLKNKFDELKDKLNYF